MDWKKNLMLATGAFASMPGAVTAHPDSINGLRRRRTGSLRRRTTTVPFVVDPKEEQSIRFNVRVPKNKARRAYGRAITQCNSYRVNASLIKLDGTLIKLETGEMSAGGGTTVEFNMTGEFDRISVLSEPTTVTARVEVTPLDTENCVSAPPLTSFTLNGAQGSEFLPSKDLDPVLLKLYHGGPIIIK